MSREVKVVENVLRVNDELAKLLREKLTAKRIFTANLISLRCGTPMR